MFHGLVTLLSIVSLSIHRIEYLERVVNEFNSTYQEFQVRIQRLELTITKLNSRLTASEATTTESSIAELVTANRTTTEMATTATEEKTKKMKTTETTTSPSTGTDSTAGSVAPYFNTSQCEFNVSGICYWSYITFDYHYINIIEAQQICEDKGSVPAYFPTELAYNRTMESLRAKIIAGGITEANVYTGVMIMIEGGTFKVIYPNTEAYMKWNPGDPSLISAWTSIFLSVKPSDQYTNQGMINFSPILHGVVCQNNLN